MLGGPFCNGFSIFTNDTEGTPGNLPASLGFSLPFFDTINTVGLVRVLINRSTVVHLVHYTRERERELSWELLHPGAYRTTVDR